MAFIDFKNVNSMVKATVDKYPNKIAYRWFVTPDQLESVTWSQFYDQVDQLAKSLIALGVNKDDKVNILSYTCYRWILADQGTVKIGAVVVGIYHSLLPKDIKYIVNHSDAVVLFAENKEQLDKILQIRDEIPNIRKVILFEGQYEGDDDYVLSFDEFLKLGEDVSDQKLKEIADDVVSSDVAAIVYTSGTTGVPKGAVLTHDNLTFTTQSALACVSIQDHHETFLFLPLAHVFARLAVYFCLLSGVPTTLARSIETVVDDIKVAKPHFFVSVPRIYEKVYSKVLSGAESKGGLALKIFRWAVSVGNQVSDLKLQKKQIPGLLGLKYKLATKLVFSKLQAALGGRVEFCISGAAPLNPDIAKFFHAAGILILEGIGMTENTSFTNVNRIDNYRFGWVGPTGPGIEMKTDEDGEVLYRGRNVMKEYYKMPEETAETLLEDGWQRTGDLGEIDSEGFLRITGRKKDLIITAGGKNIAPAPIEGMLATSKYINQVVVIGDKRKYLTALITLDKDNMIEYAKEKGIQFESFEDLWSNQQILNFIESVIQKFNKDLASYETIKRFTIVPEFSIENGLLTPTMKPKRNVIMERYAKEIEAMYPKE